MIPALEILPDALRGQAGHPLLFVATVGRLGGLRPWGRAGRRGRLRRVEAASGKPDLSYIARRLPTDRHAGPDR